MRPRLLLLLAALALAAESYRPTATLVYEGEEVVVVKTSPDELGLAWIEEREEGVLFVFFDPEPYRVQARLGKGAEASAHLALVDQPDEGAGEVLLSAGSARYLEDEDRVDYQLEDDPQGVEVRKGKLVARGRRLVYDNQTGQATLAGPVSFERGGESPLSGSAAGLVYRLKDRTLRLEGELVLRQDGRVTRASAGLVDEEAGYAYLVGDPVVSEKEGERIEGRRLRYHLESGEIWVVEGVRGRIDEGG